MTTVDSPNVHAVAVEGTFDDCQDLVKAMFNDAPFRDRHAPVGGEQHQLGAGDGPDRLLRRPPADLLARRRSTSCVPTGNFGNVLAGWIAQQMGAPIDQLVVASNTNDILTRFFNDGDMSAATGRARRSARAWTSRCRRTSSACCSR